MNLFLCIDDTDDLTKATSTGKIAQLILEELKRTGGRPRYGITRHQLLLHEEIAYTSHNSAMCMEMEFDGIQVPEVLSCAEQILLENCAPSSNPGLAVAMGASVEELIEFGFRAKRQVFKKEDARKLAQRLEGVNLRALGGDGSGIIGALAGIGLRMSGCDGSFRGKKGGRLKNQVMGCHAFCREIGADRVVDKQKKPLSDETPVVILDFAKLFLLDGKVTALAQPGEKGVYEIAAKEEGRSWADGVVYCCERFLPDNDENEYAQAVLHSCFNCLYRRWTADGFQCVHS